MPVLGSRPANIFGFTGVLFAVMFPLFIANVCISDVVVEAGLEFGAVGISQDDGAILVKSPVRASFQTIWRFGGVTHSFGVFPDSHGFDVGGSLCFGTAPGAEYRRLSTDVRHMA